MRQPVDLAGELQGRPAPLRIRHLGGDGHLGAALRPEQRRERRLAAARPASPSTMLLRTALRVAAPAARDERLGLRRPGPRGCSRQMLEERMRERAAQEAAVGERGPPAAGWRLGRAASAGAPRARRPHRCPAAPAARAPAGCAPAARAAQAAWPRRAASAHRADRCRPSPSSARAVLLVRCDPPDLASIAPSPPPRGGRPSPAGSGCTSSRLAAVARPRSPRRRAGRARGSARRRAGGCARAPRLRHCRLGLLHDGETARALDRPQDRRRHARRTLGTLEPQQAAAAAAPSASSRCRAGTRSAPRGPWRRARSSRAPRRSVCSMSRLMSRLASRSQARKPCSEGGASSS